MKRRHPGQVTDHTAFRPGDRYALIRASLVAGEMFVSCKMATFVEALNHGSMRATAWALDWDSDRRPADGDELRFTTHDIYGEIVVGFWRRDGALDGCCSSFTDFNGDSHQFFVPLGDWDADPRVHVVDWVNPDDICEARSRDGRPSVRPL